MRPVLPFLLTLVLGSGAAHAADVVLHDGVQPDAARVALAAVPDLSASATLVTPTGLTATLRPALPGPGQLRLCDGPPLTAAALTAAGREAAGHVAYFEFDQAAGILDGVLPRLVCLDHAVDPQEAGRTWFLRGYIAHEQGQDDVARRAFRQALLFSPEMPWDGDYPDSGRPLLEDARQALTDQQPLTLLPAADGATVWLDGRQVDPSTPLSMAPGEHLLQVSTIPMLTLAVDAGAGADRLLVPNLVDDAVVHQVDGSRGRARIDAALGPALASDDRLIVVAGQTVWVRSPDGAWSPAGASAPATTATVQPDPVAPPADPPPADDPPSRRRSGPGALGWSGVGLAVAGGGVIAAGQVVGRSAVSDAQTATTDGDGTAWSQAASRYDTAELLLPIGYAAAGVGGALLVTGIALDHDGPTLAPLLGPGMAGLRAEVPW
ncbi:MAG: hypothetical protein H6742_12745 [Alphaproteobacteria bacterium]|nr:hypothetical protein [Alphaproteobacteria bacterium]